MAQAKWKVLKARPEDVFPLIDKGMPPRIAAIMASRGMTEDQVHRFMNPSLTTNFPKIDDFPDLGKAGLFLAKMIAEGGKIGIWTDYDCDGACSGAVLAEFLEKCGTQAAAIHVPDRIREGYGPNEIGVRQMFDRGLDALFVLDSGTVATGVFNPLPEEMRKRIVVVDHHLPGDELPDVRAVVNPNRKDQAPGYGQMCAAGVTFLTCQAALKALYARKYDAWPNGVEPKMAELVDLVAIATVADVVPLVGINRDLVRYGLDAMSRKRRPAIQALMDVAKIDKIDAGDIGFKLGPRINATGRIGDALAGVRFLIEKDRKNLADMAAMIDQTNRTRQSLERESIKGIVEKMRENLDIVDGGRDTIVEVADGAHVGIVGILAARIKERYLRPTIVVTEIEGPDGAPLYQGSARSIDGFNIGDAIHHASDAGLVLKGGGHAMAGGVTMRPDQIDAFRAFMSEQSMASRFGEEGPVEIFDAVIMPGDVREGAVREFEMLEPCGTGNPPPRLLMNGVVADDVKAFGKDPASRHLSFFARMPGRDGRCLCKLFSVDPSGAGEPETVLRSGRPFAMTGKMSINEFRGNVTVEFKVDSIGPVADLEPEPPVSVAGGMEP